MSTDYNVDALTTTPSRRWHLVSQDHQLIQKNLSEDKGKAKKELGTSVIMIKQKYITHKMCDTFLNSNMK